MPLGFPAPIAQNTPPPEGGRRQATRDAGQPRSRTRTAIAAGTIGLLAALSACSSDPSYDETGDAAPLPAEVTVNLTGDLLWHPAVYESGMMPDGSWDYTDTFAGVQPEVLMDELLRIDSPLAAKPAHDVIHGDRKDYSDGRFRFTLAQVEETNLELLHQRRDELLAEMQKVLADQQLDFVGLMVTDAVRETSELLIIGCEELIRNLPYAALAENLFVLPGVLSRKKQLLPQVLAITAALQDQR